MGKSLNLEKENIEGLRGSAELPKNPVSYSKKAVNHLEDNFHLSNKKALYYNIKQFYESLNMDPYGALPVTFHIKNGTDCSSFLEFLEYYKSQEADNLANPSIKTNMRNIWIIKPGENSNRGTGISVFKELKDIRNAVQTKGEDKKHTYIVQKYIERPLLVNKRKFDIRCYCVCASINTKFKGSYYLYIYIYIAYFYEDGYLRTSSKEFSLANLSNKIVHLTNDAIQKKCDEYGKYEQGNKISYAQFQKYIDQHFPYLSINFYRDILSQIRVD